MIAGCVRGGFAVFGDGGDQGALVGDGVGDLPLFPEGSVRCAWCQATLLTTDDLYAIWGTAPDDVFVAGAGGVVLHFDGNVWSKMASGTTSTLRGLSGTSGQDVWAVGANGVTLHFDGSLWSRVDSGTDAILYAVWSDGPGHAWAGGIGGTLLEYDQGQWRDVSSPTSHDLFAVHGSAPQEVLAVGALGTILRKTADDTWHKLISGINVTLKALWCDASENFCVAGGYDGTLIRWDGQWSPMDFGMQTSVVRAVWGQSPTEVYLAGDQGLLAHYDGVTWTLLTPNTTERLRALWGVAGVLYVAGDNGTLLMR